MAEAKSEETNRLRNKVSEMLLSKFEASQKQVKFPPNLLITGEGPFKEERLSTKVSSGGYKSSSILTKSLAEMVDEDPIRLQNQSCAIREEIVGIVGGEQLIYSSLAGLPTYSVGLSSTHGEVLPRAPFRERSVDSKAESSHRYFQMPELGARVFIGNNDGSDTIACQLFHGNYGYETFRLPHDDQYEALKILYEDDPSKLNERLRVQRKEFRRVFKVVLSGTNLLNFLYRNDGMVVVGNLEGKSGRVSSSSFDYEDHHGDETIRQPLDIVEQPRDPIPSVTCDYGSWNWKTVEGPRLLRSPKGSYLGKPTFRMMDYRSSKEVTLQLTRFDDFIIVGNTSFYASLPRDQAIEIVRKNASETVDVIATQLVKSAIRSRYRSSNLVTVIVIFLKHKEILLREDMKKKKEDMAKKYKAPFWRLLGVKGSSQSTLLKDDKNIAKSKEEKISDKNIVESKDEEMLFVSEMEDKKGIKMEDPMVKTLGESLPNVPMTPTVLLEENEMGMKSIATSSNPLSEEVQDEGKTSSSTILTTNVDCKNNNCVGSSDVTKWIIYGGKEVTTLLCSFNVEDEQYEFYFEDHESMAAIIGLGVPHSKVVLECGSPHVIVVELPKEVWNDKWANSNYTLSKIPKGYITKPKVFPDILHRIANDINIDNIISKANNGGIGKDNGKGKVQDNAHDSKGKGHDHNDYGNNGCPSGSSGGPFDDSDKKDKKEKDENNGKKDTHDQDEGKTFKDCKEVQAVVHLRLLPGGVLEEKGKKMGNREVYGEKIEGKEKEGECHKGGEKKKKHIGLCFSLKRGRNDNFVEHQQNSTTMKGIENGDDVESLHRNQQNSTTTQGIENGDVDEFLKKQSENQIQSEMMFTFTIKDEAGGQLRTIRATIDPITFQLPSNKDNYSQRSRFGWFHDYLQVAFGVVNPQVSILETNSCKALDSFEGKEVILQGISQGNVSTLTTEMKGEGGLQYIGRLIYKHSRTYGSGAQTTKEFKKALETKKILTKRGDFTISEDTNYNTHQLKYSYRPYSPFEEELIHEDHGLKMYEKPFCQLLQVSCEGTWKPDCSENLEAYKLEARRELQMIRIYNLEPKIGKEEKKKLVWKTKPPCFIQKLEKVVYLNHSLSHLTSSTAGVYRLQERQDPSNSSTTILTQAQKIEKIEWPSNDCLVDVHL